MLLKSASQTRGGRAVGTEADRISPHILHALNPQRFMRKAQYKVQFLKISLVETDREKYFKHFLKMYH